MPAEPRAPPPDAPVTGVLVLAGHKTYGRARSGRLLYRFVPADRGLPDVLVPFDVGSGFIKVCDNRYAVARVADWSDKRPTGVIEHTIGLVSSVAAFCEYRLREANLHAQNKDLYNRVRAHIPSELAEAALTRRVGPGTRFGAEDRLASENAPITIDPAGSGDFDDAIGVRATADGSLRVSIYIADVAAWFEELGLWDAADARVCSLYMPDERKSMLPHALERLCSLRAGEPRAAIVLDIDITRASPAAEPTVRYAPISTAVVRVSKNYAHGDPGLDRDPVYAALREITAALDPSVATSRALVAYWMVQMNKICATKMAATGRGLFRACAHAAAAPSARGAWRSPPGAYTATPPAADIYAHTTSPIRRLVDIVNQVALRGDPSPAAAAFAERWTARAAHLSDASSRARKVMRECAILALCASSPHVLEKTHRGVVVGRVDGGAAAKYSVYIEQLDALCSARAPPTAPEMAAGDSVSVRLFLFESEHSLARKVRAQIVDA